MKKKIFLKDTHGHKICGILEEPNKQKRAAVVLCHGFSTNKSSRAPLALAEILSKNKIASLKIDFFGHGESQGRFADITISEGVENVVAAVNYLRQLGYKKIGIMGSSFGGLCCLMAASKLQNLIFVALRSPVSNYKDKWSAAPGLKTVRMWKKLGHYLYFSKTKGKKEKLNFSFYDDFKNNNAYEIAHKIKVPTLIVHGDKDAAVPVSQSKKIVRLIPHSKLLIIKGCNHHYTNPAHFKKGIDAIAKFIVKQCNI